jgi:hypothetical protein
MQLYQALRSGKSIEHPKAWTLCVLRRSVNRQLQERFHYEQLDELELAQSWPEEAAPRSRHDSWGTVPFNFGNTREPAHRRSHDQEHDRRGCP